jgi:hypothetical protein
VNRYSEPPDANRALLIEYAPRELAGVTLTLGERQLVPGSSMLTSLLLAPPARLTVAEHARSVPRHLTVVVLPAPVALTGASANATQAPERQTESNTRFMTPPRDRRIGRLGGSRRRRTALFMAITVALPGFTCVNMPSAGEVTGVLVPV